MAGWKGGTVIFGWKGVKPDERGIGIGEIILGWAD